MKERRLIIAGMVLTALVISGPGILALSDFEPVDSRIGLFTVLLICANILVGPALYLVLASRGRKGIAFAIAGALALASFVQFNTLYLNGKSDMHSERIHEVAILQKRMNYIGGTSIHVLTIGLWEDYRGRNRDLVVDPAVHRLCRLGGHIEVVTKPGRFGIEWIVGVRLVSRKDLL